MSSDNAPLLQINGPADAANSTADAVIRVAQCSGDPKVAIAALKAFGRLTQPMPVTVSNCTFSGSAGPAVQFDSPPVVGSGIKLSDDVW